MNNNLESTYKYLTEKYNYKNVFWYTEYPHKSFWSETFDSLNYKIALKELLSKKNSPPLVLYLHIPFCQELCYFCICYSHITHNYDRVKKYLEILQKEIALLKDFFDKEQLHPNFKEIYLGGGSPTYLEEEDFSKLIEGLDKLLDRSRLREFTIEIDPRRVDRERLRFYRTMGINRLSFGIQDFNPTVQRLINRVQPQKMVENLLTPEIMNLFPNGINFDIICGLPGQTTNSFSNTIRQVIKMSPDRISLTFLTYAPDRIKHQCLMSRNCLVPDLNKQKMLFLEVLDILQQNNYIRMGYDHFAKSSDPVAKARKQKKMAWNSFGFTPGVCTSVIGLGTHSYSTLGERFYSQNTYDQKEYEQLVNSHIFPIFRGHILSQDDLIRRSVIRQLRSYFKVSLEEVESEYDIDFKKYFDREINMMSELLKDGLVEIDNKQISITHLGQQFANIVCRIFDSYIK